MLIFLYFQKHLFIWIYLFVYILIYVLEDNCFTILCWFLPYISTWISLEHRFAYVPSVLNLPPASRPILPFSVVTEHQNWALCVSSQVCRWHFQNLATSLGFIEKLFSASLRPHGLRHARLPCPALSPRVCSNSYLLSQWCHLTISSSATLFASVLQDCWEGGNPITDWVREVSEPWGWQVWSHWVTEEKQGFTPRGKAPGASSSVFILQTIGTWEKSGNSRPKEWRLLQKCVFCFKRRGLCVLPCGINTQFHHLTVIWLWAICFSSSVPSPPKDAIPWWDE